MLLQFSVGNYRSFYRQKTLSLQAQGLSGEPNDNVVNLLSYNILKTASVYGANSSGKSNLVKAMQTMMECVLSSVRLNDDDALPYDPFLLLKGVEEPTFFEIIFLKDGVNFRYGFTYSYTRINEEWLFKKTTPRSKEKVLFIRNEDGIGINEQTFPEGVGCEEKTNDNRLFLSLCQQLGGTISKLVVSWFQKDFNVVSGLSNQEYRGYSQMLFHEKREESKEALAFFNRIQLGFVDLITRDIEKGVKGEKTITIDSIHKLYNKKGSVCGAVNFPFLHRESSGTRKLFDLSGPIFNTLLNGSVLVIDELDAKMHPLISQYIINLFNSPESNTHNAQLIFTTHDTHLLSKSILRRDQVWFTEKDESEQTDLYNLMDVVLPDGSKPRNDNNYEKNYIAGRYGAVPYIINE